MIRIWAVAFALSLTPCAALAQQGGGLGLDLTDEGQKKKEEVKPPAAQPAPAETRPRSATDVPPEPKPVNEPLFSESDITQDDRVKSVQRKLYLKRHRFELAPSVFVSVNDPYYTKVGASLRGAFYLADTLAIALRGSAVLVYPTVDVRIAKSTFQSRIFYSVPQESLLADLEWSPIYGKVAIFNSIIHFDAFLLGGLGTVVTETSGLPGRPAADLGAGLRFVVLDYLAINVALIDTGYVDTPVGTNKGATQNVLTLNAGISIFIPFSSTGREAE